MSSRRRTRGPAVGIAVGAAVLAGLCLLSATPFPASIGPVIRTEPHPVPDVVASDAGPGIATSSDWSSFHGSENRSGFSPVDGPSSPHVLWLTGLSSYPIRTSAVANGTAAFVADVFGHVFAVDLRNGSRLWSRAVGLSPTTGDLVPPLVIFGSEGTNASSGEVTAFWASNGTTAWQSAVAGRVVQGVAAANGAALVASAGGTLTGLSLATGARLFTAPLGSAAAGAPAIENGTAYVATQAGRLLAFTLTGAPLWSRSLGANGTSAPAVTGGLVVVADQNASVHAFSATTGAPRWTFSGARLHPGDAIEDTPAVAGGRVVVQTDLGHIYGLNATSGSALWNRSVQYAGYPLPSSPAASPTGVYLVDASLLLDDLDPATGQTLWVTNSLGNSFVSPALEDGVLLAGAESGYLYAIGPVGGPVAFPVSGTVAAVNGTPLAGAFVTTGGASATTTRDGAFTLRLSNGSYTVVASANGFFPSNRTVTVAGPVANVAFRLAPVPVYPVTGYVRDALSHLGLSGAVISVFGAYGFTETVRSGAGGAFRFSAPNGTNYVSVSPLGGYGAAVGHVDVAGGPVTDFEIALEPTWSGDLAASAPWTIAASFVAIAVAAFGARVWTVNRRRAAAGLPFRIFTPFGRFVAMRLLLMPVQIVVVLTILFVFGTFLPAAAFSPDPCSISVGACQGCSWSNFWCVVNAFFAGYWTFVSNLFTGHWGILSAGNIREPAFLILSWWLPNSVELALLALPLAAAIAYPVGLFAGWRRDGVVDTGARTVSLAGLLIPSFLLVLLLLGALYSPFQSSLGDSPYGTLPSSIWFDAHGGYPSWIGIADNTAPTGLPLVDGLLHRDWAFEELVLAKSLLQAVSIAVVYVAIFLRFARHAVAETSREFFVRGARARGIEDTTILWRHMGRATLPLYLLVFGATLPMYVGTQALVEILYNYSGVGSLLWYGITSAPSNGFGFGIIANGHLSGNIYQVTIFLLLILVLTGVLLVDLLARYLDPRLLRSER